MKFKILFILALVVSTASAQGLFGNFIRGIVDLFNGDDDQPEDAPAVISPPPLPDTEPELQIPESMPEGDADLQPVKKLEEKPSQKPDKKPDQKPTEKPDQKPTEKPDQKPSEKPDKKPTEKPDKKPTEKPDKKPTEKPDKKPEGKPDKKPEGKPDKIPAGKPDKKPEGKPDKKPEGKPDKKPAVKPDKKPIGKPDKKPTGKPDKKPIEKPDKKPIEKPDQKPTEKPDKKPIGKPDKKPEGKPDKKPTGKPDKKPTEKPDKKPNQKSAVFCHEEKQFTIKQTPCEWSVRPLVKIPGHFYKVTAHASASSQFHVNKFSTKHSCTKSDEEKPMKPVVTIDPPMVDDEPVEKPSLLIAPSPAVVEAEPEAVLAPIEAEPDKDEVPMKLEDIRAKMMKRFSETPCGWSVRPLVKIPQHFYKVTAHASTSTKHSCTKSDEEKPMKPVVTIDPPMVKEPVVAIDPPMVDDEPVEKPTLLIAPSPAVVEPEPEETPCKWSVRPLVKIPGHFYKVTAHASASSQFHVNKFSKKHSCTKSDEEKPMKPVVTIDPPMVKEPVVTIDPPMVDDEPVEKPTLLIAPAPTVVREE